MFVGMLMVEELRYQIGEEEVGVVGDAEQILLYSGGDYSVPYKSDNYLFVGVAESVYLCLR